MSEAPEGPTEVEWTDDRGTYWDVRQRDAAGRVHFVILTKPRGGWDEYARDRARAAVARSAAGAS